MILVDSSVWIDYLQRRRNTANYQAEVAFWDS